MKAVISADLHLSAYGSDDIVSETGLPIRLNSIMNVLEQMADYARKNDCNIIFAGDVFHNKSIIHSIAQSLFLDYVRKNSDIQFHIIDGNHDLSSKSGVGVSALKCVDNEKNVKTYHVGENVENIMFVPWNVNMMETIRNNKADYLIAHLGLNEGKLSSGISIVSDIGLKDLKNYKHVILGHYHLPQHIENSTTEVIYVGSPIQLDRGERNEEKRFLVVDTEKDEITSIPTEGYQKYYVFEITSKNKTEVLKEAKKLQNAGHIIQLRKTDSSLQDKDIGDKFDVVDKSEIDITNRGVNMSMSDTDKFNEYLSIKEIPDNEKEFYLKCALEIVNEISC